MSDVDTDFLSVAKDTLEFLSGIVFGDDEEEEADQLRKRLAEAIAKAEGKS